MKYYSQPVQDISKTSLEAVLTSGGDERLVIEADGLPNVYGAVAVRNRLVEYSYSTASSITPEAIKFVSSVYETLKKVDTVKLPGVIKSGYKQLAKFICEYFNLPFSVRIGFGPSGTDLELLSIYLALKNQKNNRMQNIVVGLNEVGSGISDIAAGQYFANRSIFSGKREKGAAIPGFGDYKITRTLVNNRDKLGKPKQSRDITLEVDHLIESSLLKSESVLVHIVVHSKTGLTFPDYDVLYAKYADNVNVFFVVDCCQGRISSEKLNSFLNSGAMVLFTGSKFYGGPPFSGALLFDSENFDSSVALPVGFDDFFSETELVDTRLESNNQKINVGLFLRWKAAEYEMRAFQAVTNLEFIKVLSCFSKALHIFNEPNSKLKLVNGIEFDKIEPLGIDSSQIALLTIDLVGTDSQAGNLEKARSFVKLLRHDFKSSCLNEGEGGGLDLIFVGQPVKLADRDSPCNANFRLSLGAPLIRKLSKLSEQDILCYFDVDFKMILRKVEFILSNNLI